MRRPLKSKPTTKSFLIEGVDHPTKSNDVEYETWVWLRSESELRADRLFN